MQHIIQSEPPFLGSQPHVLVGGFDVARFFCRKPVGDAVPKLDSAEEPGNVRIVVDRRS